MKSLLTMAIFASVAATGAAAQEDLGREEYMTACAVCHGESGKGNGPLASLLKIETPSLTTLAAEKGGGTFPFQYTLWMVDGRNIIRAHGAEMPVWGDIYTASAAATEASSETPEASELVARGRMLSLVYYIESIQE